MNQLLCIGDPSQNVMAESKGSLIAKSVSKHAGRAKEKVSDNVFFFSFFFSYNIIIRFFYIYFYTFTLLFCHRVLSLVWLHFSHYVSFRLFRRRMYI